MTITLDEFTNSEEIDSEKSTFFLTKLEEVIPAYPLYHWRHLYNKLKNPLIEYYKNAQYLEAAQEGTKIYSDLVRKKSGQETDMTSLFNTVFSPDNPVLELPDFFKNSETKQNIQKGQRSLSVGLAESFRNPTSHHVKAETKKFFNENDCLDVLSLISFLLRRVDICEKKDPNQNNG